MDLFDSSSIINQETSMSPLRKGLTGSEINIMDLSLENSADGLSMMMNNSRKKKSQITAKKQRNSGSGDDTFNLALIRSGFDLNGDTNLRSNKSDTNDLKNDGSGAGFGGDLSRNLKETSIKGGVSGDNSSINPEQNAKNLKDGDGIGRDLSRHVRDSPSKWDNSQSGRSTPIGIKQSQKASRSKSPLNITPQDRLKTKDPSSSIYQFGQEEAGEFSRSGGPSLSLESNFRKGSEAQDLLSQEKTDLQRNVKEKGDLHVARNNSELSHKADIGEGQDLKKIAERRGRLGSALIDNEIDALDRLIEDDVNKKNRTRNEEIKKGIVNNKDTKSETESPQRRKRNNIKAKAVGQQGQDPNMTQLMMLGAFNNKFREDILSQYTGFTFQSPGEIFQEKPGDKK